MEDKEFDDFEERFHWVSLCVTELKNNVATYLDNLEVRTLQFTMGKARLGSLGRRQAGPSDRLAKAPAAGTKWRRSPTGCMRTHRQVLHSPQVIGLGSF